MDSRMNPGDQQFIFFEDTSHVNVDLGTPNQHLVGQLQNDPQMMQDPNFAGQKDPNAERSFWTIEYYQKYFDVNTDDVIERLKRSMIPHGVDNYLISHIRPKPDLYGPFWVCVTLIFAIAISGNLANYFHSAAKSENYHWKYEFHIVSQAATCIFFYAWLLPLILWGALTWFKSQEEQVDDELIQGNRSIGLLELTCLYGYSLTIYIPVAFLWTIQITFLQWLLVIVAMLLSGGVLLRSLLPIFPGKQKLMFVAVILGMHLILAAGFMLYFFHMPSNSDALHATVMATSKTITSTLAPLKINHQNNSAPLKSA